MQVAAGPAPATASSSEPAAGGTERGGNVTAVHAPPTTWDRLRPRLLAVLAAYFGLTGVWVGLGLILKGPLSGTAVHDADERLARWFADRRTPFRDDLAWWGAHLADTMVKIVATAILAGIFWWLWRRWHEPALVAVSLVLEASVFITVTVIVGRPRPDVPRLEESPVSSSFPSGHTAAAAVYAALAVIVFWHTRNRIARTVVVLFCLIVPSIVGLARLYAGMHALTDVLAGALLGFATLAVMVAIIGRPEPGGRLEPGPAAPEPSR
jgi:undecaprenyl-diphosphatase